MTDSTTMHTTKVTPIPAGKLFTGTYIVPLYQREYAWGREEIWQLLDDLRDAFASAPERNYHLGSLTVFPRRGAGGPLQYELIDGQQRAITLGLLLRLLANAPMDLSGHLRFENRLEAEVFLAAFDAAPNTAPGTPTAFRTAVDIMWGHEIFRSEFDGKCIDFARFVSTKVLLFRVEMPPETDVSAYFEIMNNRGRQLEAADRIKARLIRKLCPESDGVLFDKLWTACSDMAGRLEDRLDAGTRSALETGNPLTWTQWKNVADKIDDAPATDAAPRSVIPDFPNFLLHVFRVFRVFGQSLPLDEQKINESIKEAIKTIPLDERKLYEAFKTLSIDSGDAEKFLDILLQTRLRFDRFVIKAADVTDVEVGRWILSGKQNWTSEDRERERLIHLQAMLQVTYPSRRGKEWVSRILLSGSEDAPGFISILENFVRERLADRDPIENWACAGTSTPHLALNLVDYLMYRENPDEYRGAKAFRFAYCNTVEHHFPVDSATPESDWPNGIVNDIGNLYLLSRSDNSSLNVRGPKDKVGKVPNIDILPPKRREMYQLTRKNNDWNPKIMKPHHDNVIRLLTQFLNETSSSSSSVGSQTIIQDRTSPLA